MKQSSTPPVVKSAIRAIDVLELIARAERPSTFAEIGSVLAIPNSSLFYLLNTLMQRGYLVQDGPKGSYRLGPALVALAEFARQISWAQLVEPFVESVWNELKETTSYFERRGNEMECLICKLAQHSLMPVHRVGQRSPMYIFSGGKILLAEMSPGELDAYLDRTQLVKMTKYTLATPAAVRREVAAVKKAGFAVTREEHSLGTIGVSVGLRSAEGLIGTLGVAVPAVRFDDAILKRIVATLQRAAAEFSDSHGSAGTLSLSGLDSTEDEAAPIAKKRPPKESGRRASA